MFYKAARSLRDGWRLGFWWARPLPFGVMTATTLNARGATQGSLHLVPVLLLAGSVPLFLGVLLSDITYANSNQIQWKNFASWFNAGALVLSGLALLWSVIALIGAKMKRKRAALSTALLAVGWILGFVNSLVHAKDAGATLPEGLVLAVAVFALIAAACCVGLGDGHREVRT